MHKYQYKSRPVTMQASEGVPPSRLVQAADLDILGSTPENSRRPTNGGVDEEASGSRGRQAPAGVRMVTMGRQAPCDGIFAPSRPPASPSQPGQQGSQGLQVLADLERHRKSACG